MNKLLTVISVVCLGTFGFAGSALAGAPDFPDVDVDCDTSSLACDNNYDLYSVKLNCDNLVADIVGDLTFMPGDPPMFDLAIAENDGADEVCNVSGDIDSPKTDGKCTNQNKGPNKTTGNGQGQNQSHDTSGKQVDYEIELEEEDSDYCYALEEA
jgi:hypothetical protein